MDYGHWHLMCWRQPERKGMSGKGEGVLLGPSLQVLQVLVVKLFSLPPASESSSWAPGPGVKTAVTVPTPSRRRNSFH